MIMFILIGAVALYDAIVVLAGREMTALFQFIAGGLAAAYLIGLIGDAAMALHRRNA